VIDYSGHVPPVPPADGLSTPFWEATAEGRYLVQWCKVCERPVYYPRYACPVCLSDALEWRTSGGRGVVYAFSIVHTPAAPWMAERMPYVVALVDLAEGVRILTNIVDCDPGQVVVGAAVEVRWQPLGDGRAIPWFRLTTP
jgi:uncharacterized OB-fold protein